MSESNEIELKVCKKCDAPLPFLPKSASFFNKDFDICDDCIDFYGSNEN